MDHFRTIACSCNPDIETHPLGQLFLRLIKYGPPDPNEHVSPLLDGKAVLSDQECERCVEFIYSHMINRFKGELAELLALEPCLELIEQLRIKRELPASTELYWGELIHERRKVKSGKARRAVWDTYVKGADGLLVREIGPRRNCPHKVLKIDEIIEIKSMVRSHHRVLHQLKHHLQRLAGGLRLGAKEWSGDMIIMRSPTKKKKAVDDVVLIIVVPSGWKLGRTWRWVRNEKGRELHFGSPKKPEISNRFTNPERNFWTIILSWSQEALNEAAYTMTFWYMAQVGKRVYSKDNLPKEWSEMTPEEAGYNAIKMMLYYIMLRPLSKRKDRLATRLYNVYSFGYPLGSDSKTMLWPEDIRDSSL